MPMRRPLLALLIMSALAAGACRTGAPVGVRPEYRQARVQRVVISPFYQRALFGASPQQAQATRALYEEQAALWLESQGFQVVRARELEHELGERGVWQDYQDGFWLREALTLYFEPGVTELLGAESATLKRLHAQGALPEGALLYGEVVYQSEGVCHVSAREESRYVSVEVMASVEEVPMPHPCVVSHFQAKLVWPETGQTMWFNKHLVERHVPAAQLLEQLVPTIRLVVERVLGGRDGVGQLR